MLPINLPHAKFTHSALKTRRLAIILCIAAASHAHAAGTYNSITFFGDSLTDGGYFSPVTQKIPGVTQSGQFTTNPDNTWATSFANQLGLSSVANKFGDTTLGNNYAIGGARAGEMVTNSNFGFPIPIASASSQIDTYLAHNKVDANGLYVVWAGANDLLAAFNNPQNAQGIIGSAVNSQVMNIKKLSDAGAKYILVPTIPDIGLTPDVVGTAAQPSVTYATNQFNQAMLNNATKLNANIIPLDTFGLLQQITKSPAAYGFTNVTDKACLTASSLFCGKTALITPDANDTYFFADSVHPTGRVHELIADYANAVVTAPSQMGVLPQLVTASGNITNEQVQTHLNQMHRFDNTANSNLPNNHQPIKPARNVWVTGSVQGQEHNKVESSGDSQLLVGVDFQHPNAVNAVSGIYGNLSKKQFNNGNPHSGLNDIGIDAVGVGIYHANTFDTLGGLQLNGSVGFDTLQVDVTRQVALQNYKTQYESNADGKRYYAALQAGYPLQMRDVTVTPYLGASLSRVTIDKLKETGESAVAMSFDKQKYTRSYGKIGVKGNKKLAGTLNVFGDIYYQTQLSDDQNTITANLNSLPDNKFSTPQANSDDDNGLGMTLGLSRQFGAYNANVGVMHVNGKVDDTTSVFLGLNRAF